MSVKTHNIERSLRHMVIGAQVAREHKQRQDDLLRLAEVDQEIQVPVFGEAGATIAWDEHEYVFEWPFIAAPEQRDSPYERPTFTFGYECAQAVVLTARVVRWVEDISRALVTGVVVAFGSYAPNSVLDETTIRYAGRVHMMFQGFAAPPEDETEAAVVGGIS